MMQNFTTCMQTLLRQFGLPAAPTIGRRLSIEIDNKLLLHFGHDADLLTMFSSVGPLPAPEQSLRAQLLQQTLEINCLADWPGIQIGTNDTEVELWSREWLDKIDESQFMHWVERFVTVAEHWQGILRGELIAETPKGKPAFDHLNRYMPARQARLLTPPPREK